MSSGKAHERASRLSAVIALPVVWWLTGDAYLAFGALAGGSVGVYLTPDLDVDIRRNGKRIHSIWRLRRKNGLIASLWSIYWMPYSLLIPHRAGLSHWPVLSTIIRVVYISWPLSVAVWVFGLDWIPLVWLSYSIRFGIGMFIGLCVSDTLHWLMDVISSEIKQW